MKSLWFSLIFAWSCVAQGQTDQLAVPQVFAPAQIAESRHLYFAIAGPERGLGTFGHAFLVFTAKPRVFLSGMAYGYSIPSHQELEREEGRGWLVRLLLGESFRGILSRWDGLEKIQEYSNQDRLVTLYPLRLETTQIQEIQRYLEKDLVERSTRPRKDYQMYTNNCLTHLTDAIHGVIGKENGFPSHWANGELQVNDLLSRDAWTANIPLSFEMDLRKSKLVDPSGVYQVKPLTTNLLKQNLRLVPVFDEIAVTCLWSAKKGEIIRGLMMHQRTRYTAAFLKYLMSQLKACPNLRPEAQQLFIDLLSHDLSYYSTLPEEQREVLQKILLLSP